MAKSEKDRQRYWVTEPEDIEIVHEPTEQEQLETVPTTIAVPPEEDES